MPAFWSWERKIQEKLQKVKAASVNLSIYRVPKKLRNAKEDAYSPRVVSIGPFHQDNTELAAMGEHKWRYMMYLLQKIKHQEYKDCLQKCICAVYGLNSIVRGCYAERIACSEYELAEIMLLDGCFILELFIRVDRLMKMELQDRCDPIFNTAWMIVALRHDLLLLENQIPFFILNSLYNAIKPHLEGNPPSSVVPLALKFFEPLSQKEIKEDQDKGHIETNPYKHLLDLIHKFYFLPTAPTEVDHNRCQIMIRFLRDGLEVPTVQKNSETWGFKFSASQLLEAGVKFEKGSRTDNLLDITFRNGVLRIPPVTIHRTTDMLFLNLIAFEQCNLSCNHYISSYAFLMNSLICSSQDFKLLQNGGIIDLADGDLENFPHFEAILKEVVKKDFYFDALCSQVNTYCASWWRSHRQKLRMRFHKHMTVFYSTYFSSPWTLISVIAGIGLFVLTFLQTYYTMKHSG